MAIWSLNGILRIDTLFDANVPVDTGPNLVLTTRYDRIELADRTLVSITAVDSPYAASTGEEILADASSGNITINLPATATAAGKIFIKALNTMAGSNIITISGNGNSIDGSPSDKDINADLESMELIGDGTDWWIRFWWDGLAL